MHKKKTILFAGGGTIGPVTPLLAIYDEMKYWHPDFSYNWVGTKHGPERKLVSQKHLPFYAVPEVKLDRFFSLRNLLVPFRMIWACIQAWRVLGSVRPDLILAAGGYVAVPIIWVAKIRGMKSHVHQLDVRPGLANKLAAPFADRITVTFETSLKDFSPKKTVYTGAFVRKDLQKTKTDTFHLNKDKPVVLVFGGGTGAAAINELVWGGLEELLPHAQVIHITGKGKGRDISKEGYHQYEFLTDEMAEAYEKSTVVVTRGGLGTFIELAALKKPALVIPIPGSHQEDNAELLFHAGAAVVLDQTSLSPQIFAEQIKKLLSDKGKQEKLSQKIGEFYEEHAIDRIIAEIEDLLYGEESYESE
jgi:UDP-N-acetylglucosamine--N-acetylmuramyl-(pentapeptide) pyrophosphoryl-undecaprenol N-acetylglucosamine transferase